MNLTVCEPPVDSDSIAMNGGGGETQITLENYKNLNINPLQMTTSSECNALF